MASEAKNNDNNNVAAAAADEFMVVASEMASDIYNPIRAVVDHWVKPESTPEKPVIPLSIGDPTVFGNMTVPEVVEDEVTRVLKTRKFNGYGMSFGTVPAREAIAAKYSQQTPKHPVTANDVVIASGASGVLAIVIPTLANRGDNILLPKPGFSLYRTLCEAYGIECRFYELKAEQQWQVDLAQCATLIDERTKAILVNNPSNPCGSNWSAEHIREIVSFAEQRRLPIVSDEIYADMVFEGEQFHPVASLSERVPVITIGGLAKQYLVPGWRVGWCVLNDRDNRLSLFRTPLVQMTQLILGCNSLMQAALPTILSATPPSFFTDTMSTLQTNANFCVDEVRKIPGLSPIVPQGAMYLMVAIDVAQFKDEVGDDVQFCQKLLAEEHVFVLPGSCFGAPNYFRVVFCAPVPMLKTAWERTTAFCDRYRK